MEDNSELRRASSSSMHEQLAVRLRALIAQLPADSRMPTEKDLVDRYGVSRTTVRRALGALVDEGLLVRRQGAGTFVAPQRVVHPLDRLRPFVSIFSSVGKQPEGRILRFEWAENPPQLAALGLSEGLLVRRLYTIDGAPQAVADIAVPGPFGTRISRSQIEEHPIYQVLQDLGLTLSYGRITLVSQGAAGDLAQHLGVETGHPLLVLSRTTFDEDDRVVEHATYHLLPDRFELRLTVDAAELESVSYSFSRPGPELVMKPGIGEKG
ncbi:GntR family transcriptional regulator [Amycolatopsis alkalitolerans]|uniref:GntR family transcriptional regulator n=1 Tax=Amycolatopsis alkalitolerans TaxID=2547244 RepID=A0A5C4M241_9PSEU|nr:GntR family transcriptional regulator [Amycolatopsis alkalitolerans]TNC25722.1 GntR family transcriptional regulator [Amycolatopsis alkalitolerans]